MKQLPPEIESLIWAIAENGNPQAVIEFELRYPKYTIQLHERIKMVQALKRTNSTDKPIARPEFKPRPLPPAETPRALWVGAAVLGLAALGFGAYTAITSTAKAPPVVEKPNLETPAPTGPEFVVRENKLPAPQNSEAPKLGTAPDPGANQTEPEPTPRSASEDLPKYLTRQTLRVKSAPLHSALQLIGAAGGLTVEIAPGLANPNVRLDFDSMTPIEMLKALGQDYAFSAFDEGENRVLVIPARDKVAESTNESTSPPADSQIPPAADPKSTPKSKG